MAGKSTYADLVKKNVASFSLESEEKFDDIKKEVSKMNGKPHIVEAVNKAESPVLSIGDDSFKNGYGSKSASPIMEKSDEKVFLDKADVENMDAETQDDTGFILIKGRERKHSTSSRQSSYRNSSGRPNGRRNQKKIDSAPGKKLTFDEKRDEEKVKYMNRFPKKENLCFQVKQGDVLTAPANFSLAHCVSEDFEAKDGITKQFKERFGNIENLIAQNIKTGGCAYIESKGRYLFYLVTRNFSYHRPYYSSLEKSLKDLRRICMELGVTELALPLIGNRQDQLEWDLVARILDHVFSNTNINLTIFKYKSERKPPHASRPRKRVEE